jgi:hypothetical protein
MMGMVETTWHSFRIIVRRRVREVGFRLVDWSWR